MAGQDELNRLLGKVIGQTETLLGQTKELFDKFDEIKDDVHEIKNTCNGLQTRMASIEDIMTKRVLPQVNEFAKLKQRGLGMLSVTGLLGGGLVYIFPKLAKLLGLEL